MRKRQNLPVTGHRPKTFNAFFPLTCGWLGPLSLPLQWGWAILGPSFHPSRRSVPQSFLCFLSGPPVLPHWGSAGSTGLSPCVWSCTWVLRPHSGHQTHKTILLPPQPFPVPPSSTHCSFLYSRSQEAENTSKRIPLVSGPTACSVVSVD